MDRPFKCQNDNRVEMYSTSKPRREIVKENKIYVACRDHVGSFGKRYLLLNTRLAQSLFFSKENSSVEFILTSSFKACSARLVI